MRAQWMGLTLGAMLLTTPAWGRIEGQEVQVELDPATRREVRRQRLQTEFLMLEDARTTTFGTGIGTEGKLLTIRFPLASAYHEDNVPGLAPSLVSRFKNQYQRFSPMRADNSVQDDLSSELPPFRLTLMGEGQSVHAELGAIESTLGHGSLVNRYVNNPHGGFDLSKMGVVLGANAKSVGGTVMTGNLWEPGRFIGFNVRGRPLEWIYGTYANVEPEQAGNVDWYGLLLSAITVGVTGAMDSEGPKILASTVADQAQPKVPGTAGGLSVEVDAGLNHDALKAHVYANGTVLGRTFYESTIGREGRADTGSRVANLFSAGVTPGVRANLALEIINLGAAFEYRFAGPDYIPNYFDRYYEADRVATSTGTPKIAQRTMARHGYSLQLGAQLIKMLSVFWELDDLVQVDPRFGKNDANMRLGGMFNFLGMFSVLGAYVNRGFQDYGKAWDPSRSSMWIAEERFQLLFFALVNRQWRTFEPQPDGSHVTRDGNSFLAEFQLGIF